MFDTDYSFRATIEFSTPSESGIPYVLVLCTPGYTVYSFTAIIITVALLFY